MQVLREPCLPLASWRRYRDHFQESFGGGHPWTAVSEMEARSCCGPYASTIRAASTLAGPWGSVPLRRVNAEQQVTDFLLPALQPGRSVEVTVSLSP